MTSASAPSAQTKPRRRLCPGRDFTITHEPAAAGLGHRVLARNTYGTQIGVLDWSPARRGHPPVVVFVEVPRRHRRRGVASALLAAARDIDPKLAHSTNLTPMGRAWATAVP